MSKTNYVKLKADDDFMEGSVHVHDNFNSLDTLSQADLLQDWIGDLQEMYEQVTSDGFLSDLGATGINQPPISGAKH